MINLFQSLSLYLISLPVLLANLMGSVAFGQIREDSGEGSTERHRLRVACFLDATNEAGADSFRAALARWADGLVDSPPGRVSTKVETSEEKWRELLASGTHDLYGLYPYQFLELEDRASLRPALLTVAEHGPTSTFLLVTRRSDQINSIHSLKGKKILIDTDGLGNLPLIWLATEIGGVVPPDELLGFANLRPVSNAARALLPVYFGKAHACVITRSAFKDANALNPEIITKLHSKLNSRPLLVSMFAFADQFSIVEAEKLSSSALEASGSNEARRFFALVGRQGLIRYDESALHSTRELYEKYRAIFLPPEAGEGKPASPSAAATP